jgi:hypothetical protein
MARLSRDELKQKLREQRPGFRVVERPSAEPARERGAAPDAVSPDLELPDRTRRSHGDTAGDFEDLLARRSHVDAPEDDGSTSILIVPDDADDEDASAGPKIVNMDPEGKITSEQG